MSKLFCVVNQTLCASTHALMLYVQMLPLLKRSTDNLVTVFGEKAASEESFDVMK